MRIIFLFLLMLPLALHAQFTYSIDQSIPVENNDGLQLKMPWAGGLNAIQTNTFDLNFDGQDDLVLFERMANKVVTFLRTDQGYTYHPEYENSFPKDILNWLLLRDFNCDGRKDIFTGDNLGMKVYFNTSQPNQPLSWSRYLFTTGFGGKSNVLLSKSNLSGVKVNVQLQFDDLPSIADADGDGDLDLFTMRYATNGHVEFHKNYSKERYNSCDSLDFERITQTWGGVRECSCGRFAFNGDDCSPSGGRTKHAGGKSLLSIDLNGNGEPELLLSEAECAQLFLLPNEGTLLSPVINSFSSFPPSTPATIVTYPAAYFEDVDADGKKDLMVSSNLFAREFINSDFRRSNFFYRNTGTNANPNFSLVQRDFLQSDMLEFGDNSVPAFLDFDGDNDLDLFISSYNILGSRSPITLYENVGNDKIPAFKLANDDLYGFSFLNEFNRKIQFADINNDNTKDLIYTATDGVNGATRLFFIPNKSESNLDLGSLQVVTIDLALNRNDNVYAFDVDADGKTELLVSRADGAVERWVQDSPLVFTLADQDFLGFGPSVLRQNVSVTIADLDADGKNDFVVGDQNGVIKIVPDFANVTDGPSSAITNIVYNPIENNLTAPNLGGRIWPTIANLFGSTRPAIIVGNSLGGLHVLNSDGPMLSEAPTIDVYPNPAAANQTVFIRIDRPATVEVISLLGQRLTSPQRLQPFAILETSFPTLTSGLYVLKFSVGSKSYSKKLFIER